MITDSPFFVDSTAVVDEGAVIGKNTKIWHWTHVSSGAVIGENCSLGQNVYVGNNVKVGRNVKIQNNVSIYDNVTLEDSVFCGPSMVFTNVINPRAFINRKTEFKITRVKKGATIGANSTIICGVEIGSYALIGAGAVITKNVQNYSVMVGNPAVRIGWVSTSGHKLGEDLVCPLTGEEFFLKEKELIKK